MATVTNGEWVCTAEEYHADTERISHSALEVFRSRRRLYHGRFVTKTIPSPEPTPAMRLGTLLHLAVLEPERFAAEVVREEKFDRRTKEGKAGFAEFCEQHAGKTFASPDDWETVHRMVDAVNASASAREWLEVPGKTEHSIFWQDGGTGLECKSRRDRVIQDWIIDLKKCRDASPEGFAKAAATFGYDRQAAWYLDGQRAVGEECRFLFLAACDSPPYEVAIYELNPEDIEFARAQNRKNLTQLANCWEYDDWWGPHEKQVTLLSLPRWKKYQDEYEVIE